MGETLGSAGEGSPQVTTPPPNASEVAYRYSWILTSIVAVGMLGDRIPVCQGPTVT